MATRPRRATPSKKRKRGKIAGTKKGSRGGASAKKSSGKPIRIIPNPEFLKSGQKGSIPDPVDKWVDGLGATVSTNEAFLIDEQGKKRDLEKVKKFCGQTFYVAYHFEEATAKACGGLNLEPFVDRAEKAANKTAKNVSEKCRSDGCRPRSKVVYEKWSCNGVAAGGSSVHVELVIEVECLEI